MTDKQPEALRLADELEEYVEVATAIAAVAELRRQHGEIESMRAKRLRTEQRLLEIVVQRDELLEALRGYVNDFSSEDGMYDVKHYVKVFSEVIARAEELL